MRKRAKKYGLHFFHVLLPGLGKDLEKALDTGHLDVTAPTFKLKKGTALPRFLYELFIRVFEYDGYIRDEPEKIVELRQLTLMFYKFEMPFDSKQLDEAITSFIERDASVKTDAWPHNLWKVSIFFKRLLPDDPMDIRPHHASGASAVRVSNLNKRRVRRYYPSLMGTYDFSYFFHSKDHAEAWLAAHKRMETAKTMSKLTFVPKDSRGPRSICMEPHELMFIQKGLQAKIYDYIEEESPAKGYINFTDQSINRRLAQYGSVDGSLATIDLKDASDLVSWSLIKELVDSEWLEALTASRSASVLTPVGEFELNKYAPMGSALCFPIEAMLFYSIARTVAPQVWVYGDDIIVAKEFCNDVIEALESYGLKVNHGKTLQRGFFRESCGGDYYRGKPINYIKCKSYDTASFIAFANLITDAFDLKLSGQLIEWYENIYQTIVYREPPSNRDSTQTMVYYTPYTSSSDVFFRTRWDEDLQRFEVRRPMNVAVTGAEWNTEKTDRIIQRMRTKGKIVEPFYSQMDYSDEYDRYYDWLVQSCTSNSPLGDHINTEYARVYDEWVYPIVGLPGDLRSPQRDTKPVIKFVWGVKNPVL